MKNIKTFESFQDRRTIYIANPLAEQDYLYESTTIEGFITENVDSIVSSLLENNFQEFQDFLVLDEELKVKYEGHESGPKGVEIFVDINGHKYGYTQKDGDLDIGDVARKFEKMLQFSAGRALSWLKKHTILSSGSKKQEQEDAKQVKEGANDHLENYMFFANLQTIMNDIKSIMEMDHIAVDQMLADGHSWAADHIATSKDDIEEVANWLKSSIKK
jgi:hypothetical protein